MQKPGSALCYNSTMSATALCVRLIDPSLDPGVVMWGDATGACQPSAFEWLGTLVAAGVPVRAGADTSVDDGEGLLLVPDPDSIDFEVRIGRPLLTGPPPEPEQRLAAVRDALGALVRPDMRGVMALRLDDPGASMKRLLQDWAHDDVPAEAWSALWAALGDGRMSVFCCPGWVCGDGTIVPSRSANPDEWAHLDEGRAHGFLDLECHGFTHLDPDVQAWLGAPDGRTNPAWFREMWPPRFEREPSVEAQVAVIGRWQAECGSATALVAPGEAWGLNTVTAARRQGLKLFNSWGICRLDLPVPTWSVGVGSPYLDEADPAWCQRDVPVVGYWHDRDMAVAGPSWAPGHLEAWRECGIRRLVAFSDLAAAYGTEVDAALVDGEVVVRRAPPGWPLRVEHRGRIRCRSAAG